MRHKLCRSFHPWCPGVKNRCLWLIVGQHYRKTSSISRTKSQSLNGSCILAQLSSFNPLKPGVKLRMKMQLEQRRQAMLQLHLSYQQFYCLLRCDLYKRFYGSSDNGLMADDTKPWPKPMLTYQWSPVPFIWGLFYKRHTNHQPLTINW